MVIFMILCLLTQRPSYLFKILLLSSSIIVWWLTWLKNLPAIQETQVRSLDQEDALEKGIAAHSSILAWEIPWQRSLVGKGFHGIKRVGHTEWLTLLLSIQLYVFLHTACLMPFYYFSLYFVMFTYIKGIIFHFLKFIIAREDKD